MKKTVLMTGLAMAIGLGALSDAHAQDTGQGMGQGMGHGMMGEGRQDMVTRFEGADTDGDGKLSRDEIIARMTERAAERIATLADRMIERHDTDGDGMLSLEELKAGSGGGMFDRLDADGDGVISREEFAKMREMMHKGKGGDDARMRGHHGAGYQGHHGKGRSMGQGQKGQTGVVIHHHHYYHH